MAQQNYFLPSESYYEDAAAGLSESYPFDIGKLVTTFLEKAQSGLNAIHATQVIETYDPYLSVTTATALLTIADKLLASDKKYHIITDLDETVFNPLAKHHQYYNSFFAARRQELADMENPEKSRYAYLQVIDREPTLEEIIASGTTHNAYAPYGQDYIALNKAAREDPDFNRDLPLIDGNIPFYVGEVAGYAPFSGILTTRPECLQWQTEAEFKNLCS